MHAEQAARIERRLKLCRVLRLERRVNGVTFTLCERFANELRCLHYALDLRRQRLPFNAADDRQCRRQGGVMDKQHEAREDARTEETWSKHHRLSPLLGSERSVSIPARVPSLKFTSNSLVQPRSTG